MGGGQKLMDVCGSFAEGDNLWVEGFSFLLTAVLLLTSTYISKKKKLVREVNTIDAFAVGVAQAFAAAFPGLSRSGSTISTGMMCGVNKEYMVQYSFVSASLDSFLSKLSNWTISAVFFDFFADDRDNLKKIDEGCLQSCQEKQRNTRKHKHDQHFSCSGNFLKFKFTGKNVLD